MLPSGWHYINVAATYRGANGEIPSGSVRLYTDQVVSGEGVTVVPRSFVADISSADGSIDIDLPAPNYPDLGFTSLYYHVIELFPGGRAPFVIKVAQDSSPIDLTAAVPVVTPPELVGALSASIVQTASVQAGIASSKATASANSATAAAASATAAAASAVLAGNLASGALIFVGIWDATTGAYPTPPAPVCFWKVTGSGTVSGVDFAAGDQLIWSGDTNGWLKIDNTENPGIEDVVGLTAALAAKLDATATAVKATKLATARKINGVDFDGSADITIGQLDAVNALSISSGAVAIDCALGDAFTLALTANVTAVTFANLLAAGKPTFAILKIAQDATGGRTIAWPSSVKWAGGTAYVPSAAANAVDTVGLMTLDAGTTWQGVASKAFA